MADIYLNPQYTLFVRVGKSAFVTLIYIYYPVLKSYIQWSKFMLKKYRYFYKFLIMTAAFVGTNIFLGQVISQFSAEPVIRTYTIKVRKIEQNPHKYNLLFVGSSHIHYHLMPSIFDSYTRKQGMITQSFNMGSPTLDVVETHEMIRRILDSNPNNLKYIFIEPRAFNGHFQPPDGTRQVLLHNFENTLFSLSYTLHSNLAVTEKLSKISSTLKSFSFNFLNAGRLHQLVTQQDNQELDIYSLGPEMNGFAEMKWYCRHIGGQEGATCLKKIQKFSEEIAQEQDFYQSVLTNHINARQKEQPFSPSQIQTFENLARTLKKYQVEAVFLVPPTLNGVNTSFRLAYERYKPSIRVFDYDVPEQYPELFENHLWYDETHLNHEGAKILSRYVAKDFLQMVYEDSGQ